MAQTLEQQLDLESGELDFLKQCSEEDLARLQSFFDQAHEAQKLRVEEAIESGLQIVPKLLRKPVRKLFGEK